MKVVLQTPERFRLVRDELPVAHYAHRVGVCRRGPRRRTLPRRLRQVGFSIFKASMGGLLTSSILGSDYRILRRRMDDISLICVRRPWSKQRLSLGVFQLGGLVGGWHLRSECLDSQTFAQAERVGKDAA